MSQPTHNAERARSLLRHLRRLDHDITPLLRIAGMSPEDLDDDADLTIKFTDFAQIWEKAAELADDPCLGLHFSAEGELTYGNPIGYVSKTAPTLRAFLASLAQFTPVFSEAFEFDIADLDKSGTLRWHIHAPADTPTRQMMEGAMVALVRGVRTLTGRAIRPASVSFTHFRDQHREAFDHFFGCAVTFGAAHNAVVFRQDHLDLPLLTQDARLHGILRDVCSRVMAERASGSTTTARRVEKYMSDNIENGWPSQDSIARHLGLSKRTLARRLADEGTSFRDVSNGLRSALAARYVRDSDLPLTEIAFMLGYTDVSAFSNAFHRWTGSPPNRFRQTERRV